MKSGFRSVTLLKRKFTPSGASGLGSERFFFLITGFSKIPDINAQINNLQVSPFVSNQAQG